MENEKNIWPNYFNYAILCVIFISFTLSLIQFFSGRSLWMDEAFLGLNIIEKSYFELLQHLDHAQVAPPLFLLIEKFFYTHIPNADWALRLFPLCCFWLTMYFYVQLSKLYLKTESARFVSISLLSLSTYMLFYSSEVKQYMTDTTVTTGMFYLLIKPQLNQVYRSWLILIAGLISLFISHISVIILFAAGIYLLIQSIRTKTYMSLVIIGVSWIISFVFIYIYFIHDHPTRAFMLAFWAKQQAFMPMNLFSFEFLDFIIKQAATICTLIIPELKIIGRTILPILLVIGIIALLKNRGTIQKSLLLLIPVPLHLILSSLKLYPFDARLYLYTVPIFILIIGLGYESFQNYLSKKYNYNTHYAILLFPLLSLWGLFLFGFPIKKNEIKPLLSYYNENAQNDEGLYISVGAQHIAQYYHETNYFIPKGAYCLSTLSWEDSHIQRVNEIKELGEKIWIVFNAQHMDDVKNVTSYLDKHGFKQLDKFDTTYGSIYLYDLCPSEIY